MLADDQLELFDQQGYLVVDGVLSEADLDPVRNEYSQALDRAANDLFDRGELEATHQGLDFEERYIALLSKNSDIFYYLGVSLPLDYEDLDPHLVRCHTGSAFFGLLSNPKLLDTVESILGPEISTNPVQQARIKPPQHLLSGDMATYSNVGATTWHQDFGAVMDEAADTEMVTVWVAMMNTTVEMGCLQAIPGSHRAAELTLHCPGRVNTAENYIPQPLLERHTSSPVPLPVAQGSLVLINKFTEHGALPNISNQLRWSFDLRYQKTGQPTGRPAFPSFVVRSNQHELATAASYQHGWSAARDAIVEGGHEGALYEQDRWLRNQDNPVCA